MDSPIRKWLEKKGMSQIELAEKLGIKTQTVNAWCNNKNTNMFASNIAKVCEITGIKEAVIVEWAAHHSLEESGWDDREAV